MACISNTLSLETFWASEALLPELKAKGSLEVNDTPQALRFNDEGQLLFFPTSAHAPKGKWGKHD